MFTITGELWMPERGPWVTPWDEIPTDAECVVRLVIVHRGYTFKLQGADNYWFRTTSEGVRFGQFNDPVNRWGLGVDAREWRWDRGSDSQVMPEYIWRGGKHVRRGVWVPPELDPYGIADGTVEP